MKESSPFGEHLMYTAHMHSFVGYDSATGIFTVGCQYLLILESQVRHPAISLGSELLWHEVKCLVIHK